MVGPPLVWLVGYEVGPPSCSLEVGVDISGRVAGTDGSAWAVASWLCSGERLLVNVCLGS